MSARDDRLEAAQAIPLGEVLDRLGISGLSRGKVERAGPCPVCGGKDRFGVNLVKGIWLCRRCDAGGDAIALVQFVKACDFPSALDYLVGAELELDPVEAARRRAERQRQEREKAAEQERFRRRAIEAARAIWGRALAHPSRGGGTGPITPVEEYLAARGLSFEAWPPTLRYLPDHAAIKQIGHARVELHRGPAMIAAIQNARGQLTAVHQTWIDPARPGKKAEIALPDGSPAPAKMVRGSKKGGAIRLTPAPGNGVMVMGEGIETTASILAAGGDPAAAYWAGVDLGNMSGRQEGRNSGIPDLADHDAFVPPHGIGRLIFLMDGDSDPKSTRAKLEAGLRRAAHHRPGIATSIVEAEPGRDFNDMIKRGDRQS